MLITGMSMGAPLRHSVLREMPVVVVQATERQPSGKNQPSQSQDGVDLLLRHARAVHPGIYIDKSTDGCSPPLLDLLVIFHQHRNSHARVLPSDLAHALRVGADQRISYQNIARA